MSGIISEAAIRESKRVMHAAGQATRDRRDPVQGQSQGLGKDIPTMTMLRRPSMIGWGDDKVSRARGELEGWRQDKKIQASQMRARDWLP